VAKEEGFGTEDSSPQKGDESSIGRRRFLQIAAAGATGIAGLAIAACGDSPSQSSVAVDSKSVKTKAKAKQPSTTGTGRSGDVTQTKLASGVIVPTAKWLVEENAKPGTLDWAAIPPSPNHSMEGYASQVSAVSGDDVAIFVNTTSTAVQVKAYRIGYYQGLGGRLIYQSDMVAAGPQAAPVVTPGTSTVTCPWKPTLSVRITDAWPPGCYLLKLVGNGGEEQYVPLTIRDDASTAAFVIQNSVTTWQAYNLFGGYSLYYGLNGRGGQSFADRARVVSFDRPYPQNWGNGSADFMGNEFPLLYHLESLGVDLTYWTDVDLHARPTLLTNHRCLFSLGHDEYWSAEMRNGATVANQGGVNLAFLGANASYRQIRMEPTSVGPNRLEICYKDAAEDPMSTQQPSLTTVNWNQPPVNNPESTMIGSTYQSVGADADTVVTDASNWFYAGSNLTDGQVFPKTIIGEYDRYVPSLPGPRNLDVLAHSPIAGQGNWSDITYFTAGQSGGGVLASGSATFVSLLSNSVAPLWPAALARAVPGVTEVLLRSMENVYGLFGNGPASKKEPSTGNWTSIYSGGAANSASPAPTVGA